MFTDLGPELSIVNCQRRYGFCGNICSAEYVFSCGRGVFSLGSSANAIADDGCGFAEGG